MRLHRLFLAGLFTTLALAATLVFVLGLRARDLREQNRELARRIRYPFPGFYVPTFSTTGPDRIQVVIGEAPVGERQVLVYLTTTCPYCLRSLGTWKLLYSTLDTLSSPRTRMFALSLDSVDATWRYGRQHALSFPVLHFPDEKIQRLYRARAVPQTIVLDADGRVLYAHAGVFESEAVMDSVLAAVRLPSQPVRAPAVSDSTEAQRMER